MLGAFSRLTLKINLLYPSSRALSAMNSIICLPNRVSVTVRTDEEDVGKASPEESGNRSVPDAVVGTADGAAGSEGGGIGSGDGENR